MIPFENIGAQLSQAFDNDLITFASDDWDNTNRYPEGVPCHLSIKSTDDPATDEVVAESRIPVQMYAQLNFDVSYIFKAKDYVRAEKHDQNGEVIATYEGRIGVPAYRQSRAVAQMKITKVEKVPPTPIRGLARTTTASPPTATGILSLRRAGATARRTYSITAATQGTCAYRLGLCFVTTATPTTSSSSPATPPRTRILACGRQPTKSSRNSVHSLWYTVSRVVRQGLSFLICAQGLGPLSAGWPLSLCIRGLAHVVSPHLFSLFSCICSRFGVSLLLTGARIGRTPIPEGRETCT